MKSATHHIDATTGLYLDINDKIRFAGNGDQLILSRGSGDTITAVGTNQTIGLNQTGPDTIIDHGYGLHLVLSTMVAEMTVKDFQRDPAAHVTIGNGQTGSLSPDGHGGTLLSITFGQGASALHIGSVDFVGDRHVVVT